MALLDLMNLTKQTVDPDINHYRFTITGGYGTGKSTFANELFNRTGSAVAFGFEDRFKGIEGIRVVRIDSWDEAKAYLNQIKAGTRKANKLPFNNIIIDPVGRAGAMIEQWVCKKCAVDALSDIDWGQGYSMVENEFNSYVDDLNSIGFNVNFVAHGKLATIKPPRGKEYGIFQPDVPKKMIYKTQGEADFICYLDVVREVDEETGKAVAKRRLYLQNYADFQLKVPIKGLPDYIEYTEVEDGVTQFLEAFNKAVDFSQGENDNKQGNFIANITDNDDVVKKEEVEDDATKLTKLQDRAAEVRENNLKKNGGTFTQQEMKKYLEEHLGTYKVSECKDVDKLEEYIGSLTK